MYLQNTVPLACIIILTRDTVSLATAYFYMLYLLCYVPLLYTRYNWVNKVMFCYVLN